MESLSLFEEPRVVQPWVYEAAAGLFGATALLTARLLVRIGRPSSSGASPVNTGLQMRRRLLAALFVANAVRCLSLLAELGFKEHVPLPFLTREQESDPYQLRWIQDLITLLPAVVFLTAFSVVVLFFAQLHYTTTIVQLPLLDCLFVCVNIACYLLVTAIAVCTFLLHAYSHLQSYLICIIGFLNTVLAAALSYYGFMVVSELAETSRKKMPGRRLTLRVVILTVSCPLALLLRGGCYLTWGLTLGHPSKFADLALCLFGEWFPAAVAILIINPLQRAGPKSPADSLGDSTDSEAPLLHDDPPTPRRILDGAPGLAWKQLYPQPTNA